MTTPQKEYSMEELEERYNDIAALYDITEELVSTVESDLVKDQETQLKIVEPLIHEIGEAADVLTEEFTLLAEQNKQKGRKRASKQHIEAALRRAFTAIADYHARAREMGKKSFNIADAAVQKLQRQLEKVVVIFIEFIQISLQNLMGKAELEALKVRDARIALFMHQQALAQQQGGNI